MATFKVGQRVKVRENAPPDVLDEFRGRPGTFVGYCGSDVPLFFPLHDCRVRFDGEKHDRSGMACTLVPLTDPRAEEFIADMERFAHIAQKSKVPA